MNPNASLAGTIINTAIKLGVEDFVVCAGARNAPLIRHLQAVETVSLWNHFDERAAAFFALGLATPDRKPVAIVTTSGTAVAELLPATIEAWYAKVPLVLITADRPAIYRGSGAPQAIEQIGIFTNYVDQAIDIEYTSTQKQIVEWDQRSPIHFNVCFEEPTECEPDLDAIPLEVIKTSREIDSLGSQSLPKLENPICIVGGLTKNERPLVATYLETSPIPTWFEATSGLREDARFTKHRIVDESDIVSTIKPTEVIRFGAVPSLRYWRDLETDPSIQVINYTSTGFSGLARTDNVSTLNLEEITDRTGYGQSPYPVRFASELKKTLAKHPESEPAKIRELSKLIPSEAVVFLGNSLPIREWNLAADHEVPHPECYANRGANGIDGEISCFLGIAGQHQEAWGIFGDLTTLYDLNAPWIINQLTSTKLRIVVINNSGGRIFSRLPSMKGLGELAENNHQIDFKAWATMWQLEFCHWQGEVSSWQQPTTDRSVIELTVDQQVSEKFWQEFRK